MKKIIIVAETEFAANFRYGAFEKAVEFEEKYMKTQKIGRINNLVCGVTDMKTGEKLAEIYIYHTKTSIVATIIKK